MTYSARTLPRARVELSRRGGSGVAMKGVVIVGLLAVLLGGCAMGGKSQADAAVARFEQIEYVTGASTSVTRPGLPTNTNYFSKVTVVEGLSDADLALVIDQVLLVAREELAPTATGGASFFFRTAGGSIDLRDAVPLLGGVGQQSIANTAVGDLSFSKDTLKAHVSPSED